MSINFNIERAMRDKVGKYYFSRSDPDVSCRCGTGVGSGLHFDPVLKEISGARKRWKEKRNKRQEPSRQTLADFCRSGSGLD
jgi:hypothetical protein